MAVGDNTFGQLNVSSWTNIKTIAAGGSNTVGLKDDGTVVAVGFNYGLLNVSSWTNIKAVAAGVLHTVGVKEDGTVVAVGFNYYGELNVSSWTNIKAIATGYYHTVGVKEDGTVVAVGFNYGQLNVSSWTNIKTIAAGGSNTVGLKDDGTVKAVGDNGYGQLNTFDWSNIRQPICYGVPAPDISSSTALIAFGAIELGSSATQSLSISNIGAAELSINSISISGLDSNQFSQTNNCSSVASNAACSISVAFSPISLGAKNASLNIASNDPDTPTLTIPLTGSGVDTIPPTTSSMISGVPGNHGWYKSDVQLTLTSTDNYAGSGVKEIHYIIDGSETVVAGSSATFTVSLEGAHIVSYFAKDNADNSETAHVLSVKIDKTPPSIPSFSTNPGMLWPPNHKMVDVLISGSAADYGSDVASVVISVVDEYGVYNMTGLSFGGTVRLEAWREGTDRDGRQYTITAVVTDKAGNRSTATTAVLVPHDMRP